MKNAVLLFVLLFAFSFAFGQNFDPFNQENNSSLDGGLGVTFIDGKAYTTFTIAPEFAIGKFGVGLNIELLFNNSEGFKFRQEGWKTGAGVLRMIRYLRWGVKHDPLYVRIGTLQAATLGHGFIMGYYSNGVNYDGRKIGLVFDLDLENYGFETVYSNLGRLEIVGGRAYVRPLSSTGIPIIKNFEIGGTFVTDADPDQIKETHDAISEWGFDIGLPIIKTSFFTTTLYSDYAKINNHGDGAAVGIRADLPNVLGLMGIYAKLERRFLNDHFVPNYFNTMYELERNELSAEHYNLNVTNLPAYLTKAQMLDYVKATQGLYGELAGQILGKIRLGGSYQHANGVKNSGILHLEARSKDLVPNVELLYAYDKVGVETFTDALTLDYRSVATAEIGYRTYRYIVVSLQYRWNFIYDSTLNNGAGGYKPQERFQPKVSFSMPF